MLYIHSLKINQPVTKKHTILVDPATQVTARSPTRMPGTRASPLQPTTPPSPTRESNSLSVLERAFFVVLRAPR